MEFLSPVNIRVVSSLAVPLRMSTVAIKIDSVLISKTWQKSKNNPNKHFDRGVGAVAPIFKGMHSPINKLGTAKLEVFQTFIPSLFTWRKNFGPDLECVTKIYFLISQPKHLLWVLKRTVQWDGSFEDPKHTLKLIYKKIITILRWKFLLNWSYAFICVSDHTVGLATPVFFKHLKTRYIPYPI